MEYRTLRTTAEAEFTERRSRFIGRAAPVSSEEEATAFIREVRARCRDATHNVYAYVLRDGTAARYSDDGEPHGTAGMPTLDVLTKSGVTDAVVVTTRYFGGILLGAGGLVRAYGRAAHDALEAAGIVAMRLCKVGTLHCGHHQYSAVARVLAQGHATVEDTAYAADVTLRFFVLPEALTPLTQALADATAGSVTPVWNGERYVACED